MAEINPPLYLDQDAAYGPADLGIPYRDIMGEGVVGSGDLAVTAGTGLKSSVAAGAAWIKGDDDANAQPTYRVRNDAAVLLQHDAADATNARIDLVVAQVLDSAFSGVSKLWKLALVKGTPAASPAVPALPNDAIKLAQVTIPAGSGTLGTITDLRTRALVGAGAALVNAPVTASGAAYGSSSTNPGVSTWADLLLDSVLTDSGGVFSVSHTTRASAPSAGLYEVRGMVIAAGNDGRTATISSRVVKNGTTALGLVGTASCLPQAGQAVSVPTSPVVVSLAAGDYVTLQGQYAVSGISLTLQGQLSLVKVG